MIQLNGTSKQNRGDFSDKSIKKLRKLCKEQCGLELSEKEALETARCLLDLYRAVYETSPHDSDRNYQN